jgi:hypothetical protein
MIEATIGVGVTILLGLAGVIYTYGRNVQALTVLTKEVSEMRGTLQRLGERVGRLEARDEVEREFSGRVR